MTVFETPRFQNIDVNSQPNPVPSVEILKNDGPIVSKSKVVACEGRPLVGHPKVFINLVLFSPKDYG